MNIRQQLTKYAPLILLTLTIAACQSEADQVTSSKGLKYEDEEIIKIYELVDKRNALDLLPYLDHEKAEYRYEAAMGLASVQDSATIGKLAYALNDESAKVRKAAAYALGQLGDSSAISPLFNALQGEDSLYVRRELLESLGKVITQPELARLQYWPLTDEEDRVGMAWGLYRAGIRNVHDSVSVAIAISLLDSSNTYDARLGAAHFLSRTRNLKLADYADTISHAALQDKSPFVRMAAVLALRNVPFENAAPTLKAALEDRDYRVRINALRTIAAIGEGRLLDRVIDKLDDQNLQVGITAAGIIRNEAKKTGKKRLTALITPELNKKLKAPLYAALLKVSQDKEAVINTVRQEYAESDDPYYQAALLEALSVSILAYDFVVTQTFESEHKAVSTAGISALAAMRALPDFPDELRPAFSNVFQEAIETKDIAMVAMASSVIINPTFNYKEEYANADFLKAVRDELSLPKDMEAIQAIDRAIAFLNDEHYEAPKNAYNAPIDWKKIKSFGDAPKARIVTDNGEIVMRLLLEESPGSVLNFISLAEQKYFDGKVFHRVVPNFVIQGGCNRGDGYGGEDYSIRSELSDLRYQEGSVGMASAGKDTEGTQWFITHSPTPHLDGRYTIFGQVEEGMDVVHNMAVGDQIIRVEIL